MTEWSVIRKKFVCFFAWLFAQCLCPSLSKYIRGEKNIWPPIAHNCGRLSIKSWHCIALRPPKNDNPFLQFCCRWSSTIVANAIHWWLVGGCSKERPAGALPMGRRPAPSECQLFPSPSSSFSSSFSSSSSSSWYFSSSSWFIDPPALIQSDGTAADLSSCSSIVYWQPGHHKLYRLPD